MLNFRIKKISFLFFFIFSLLNFKIVFSQSDSVYKTETIEVDALRGIKGLTPITFQNIDRTEIERKYWMQDLPMFLSGNTSINAFSESGASIGYSYMSLRGFDQRRLSIMINGTPQNDPEDHQVYWVDLSDITSSVEDIQIQRGIGTALYGSSAIGGVINIQTIDFTRRNFFNAIAGYGDYNSKRYSLEYSSGLINGGLAFYGKFTKTKTDGYRDLSFSDHWSYFLSGAKVFKNSVLKLNFYGGPIKNHLAYYGVTKEYLDGEITGDPRVDRKVNYLEYQDETDNYNQPHYELVYNWQPMKNLFISNTVNYIRGEGYFNTSFPAYWGYDYSYFRLDPFYTMDSTTYNPEYYQRDPNTGQIIYYDGLGYQVYTSDLVTRLYVNNNTYGWFPKVQISHSNNKGNLVVGGELKFHESEHYGEITYGEVLPPDTPPNYQYYFYNGKKRTFSFYANEVYKFNNKISGMLGLQYVNHKYTIENDKFKPYSFDVDYNFFTPRFGLNYSINDNIRFFANFSIAKREPRLKDIYDAESPYSTPNFETVDTVNGIYENPLIKPETMFDYELGIGYKNKFIDANLNFYLMDFQNEIVNNGQLDNVGQPIVGNAGKSVHRGMELEFDFIPFYQHKDWKGFSITGNLNLSQNYFKEYVEVLGLDSEGNIIYGNDYSGNKILLSPEVIGNLSLNYYSDLGIGIYVAGQHIGRQYLDNSENERKNPSAIEQEGYVDKVIEPYTVVNAGISFNLVPILKLKRDASFNKIEVNLKVNNVFDTLYETTGSVDGSGTPYWIPAATRNFFVDLRIGF